MSITVDKLIDEISNRENLDLFERSGMYRAQISREEIVAYLKTEPDKIDCLANLLNLHEIKDIISSVNNDAYKTKLLLTCNYESTEEVLEVLPYVEDEYLRTLILYKAIYENRENREIDFNEYVDWYYEFKNQEVFFKGTEEEQALEIAGIQENEVKKAMLGRIKNKDNREKIIQSMTRYVEDDIEEAALLSEKMIKEFLESHGGLTEEMRERMEIIFRSVDMYYTDRFRGTVTYGEADHLFKRIEISDYIENNPMRLLQAIIHEYAHTFSNAEFRRNGHITQLTYEEGIADLFSDMVINEYFSKHPSVVLGNEELKPELPYIIDTGYKKHHGWTRTILYPLSRNGSDIEAINQFLLGDKNIFWDMTLGEHFSDRYSKDYMGNPIIEDYNMPSCLEIYEAHKDEFYDIDKDSIYYRQNFMLPAFIIQEKVENLGEQNIAEIFDEGRAFNHIFINNIYFGGRKLYEISRRRV